MLAQRGRGQVHCAAASRQRLGQLGPGCVVGTSANASPVPPLAHGSGVRSRVSSVMALSSLLGPLSVRPPLPRQEPALQL